MTTKSAHRSYELTTEQLAGYERDGFVTLAEHFTPLEVATLKTELARIQGIDTDHLVREKSGGVAKTIYRVHEIDGPTASLPFHRATRSPRLLTPAQQLLADHALYVYHTKCNLKTAIDGSIWMWHQDYGTWQRDGVAAATLTTALIMLDEPTELNGCLYFIPGSHKLGRLEPEFDSSTGYKFWVIPKSTLVDLMQRSPAPVAITGKPGTVTFFHPNIVHASGHNLSCNDRWQVYVVYNQVANQPKEVPNPRPDYVRSTHFTPLVVGTDQL
jgi:ectoine hydroxylase